MDPIIQKLGKPVRRKQVDVALLYSTLHCYCFSRKDRDDKVRA